ncbi:hypothetical protein ACJRO7_005399 [Eucalyptus globulus]|uniref:SKP1-like protein n=1 Tax=Eucalyptus globulus TaxID=34317 RepID=A0ABD3J389_EUCGL
MSSAKKITFRSSEEESFDVDKAVAIQSQVVKELIEDDCADVKIPLPNVPSRILAKVIEYCRQHIDLKAWDAEFVKVDQTTLCDLILAADYLNIEGLLDLTRLTLKDMIKGKTREDILKSLSSEKYTTPEEKEECWRKISEILN